MAGFGVTIEGEGNLPGGKAIFLEGGQSFWREDNLSGMGRSNLCRKSGTTSSPSLGRRRRTYTCRWDGLQRCNARPFLEGEPARQTREVSSRKREAPSRGKDLLCEVVKPGT